MAAWTIYLNVGWRRLARWLLLFLATGFLATAFEVRNLKLGRFKARAPRSATSEGWELEGAQAVMSGSVATLTDARLVLFLADGDTLEITSPGCLFDDADKTVRSGESIQVRHRAFSLDGVGYTVFSGEHKVLVHDNVRMVIKDEAMGGGSIFRPARSRRTDEPGTNENTQQVELENGR